MCPDRELAQLAFSSDHRMSRMRCPEKFPCIIVFHTPLLSYPEEGFDPSGAQSRPGGRVREIRSHIKPITRDLRYGSGSSHFFLQYCNNITPYL